MDFFGIIGDVAVGAMSGDNLKRRMIDDLNEFIATVERIFTDACDALGNRDTSQTRAILECCVADICNTARNLDARKIRATVERRFTDAHDAVRNRDTRQARMSVERPVENLIRDTKVVFRQDKLLIFTDISEQIVDSVNGIEKITVLILDLAFSCMHFFCIVGGIAVGSVSDNDIEGRMIDDLNELIAIVERILTDV